MAKSTWNFPLPKFKSLVEDLEVDIAIVGGGLTGLWCAYLLSKEGKSVALVEKDELGQAATGYTTAFITQVIDTDFSQLVKMFGKRRAVLAWEAGKEAIEKISKVIKEEEISCEFTHTPLFSYAETEQEFDELVKEERLMREAGLEVSLISGPLRGFRNLGALKFSGEAKFDPLKFFAGLVKAAQKNGVKIFEHTEALEVGNGEVRTKNKSSLTASEVIVATYEPLNNPKPIHFKKGMYVSYVYELELPKGRLVEGLYEDRKNPYHYFRIDDLGDKQRMIVGGEDHRKELAFEEAKSFRALKEYIDETFLDLNYRIKNRWSGEILEPSDGLPLIGKYAPHKYLAAAFSGNGMTYSALTGIIITDLILGRGSRYELLYDPKRKMESRALAYKFRDYAGEFFGGAVRNLFK